MPQLHLRPTLVHLCFSYLGWSIYQGIVRCLAMNEQDWAASDKICTDPNQQASALISIYLTCPRFPYQRFGSPGCKVS